MDTQGPEDAEVEADAPPPGVSLGRCCCRQTVSLPSYAYDAGLSGRGNDNAHQGRYRCKQEPPVVL